MKLRYQLVVAVLIVTLMVSSFVAGRQFETMAAASQGHRSLTRLVSTVFSGGEASASGIEDVDLNPLQTFQEVLNHVRHDYVSPVRDERKLTYAAINGMLTAFRESPYDDRYTRFLEPVDYRGFLDENEGHFGGIGAEIGLKEVKAVKQTDDAKATAEVTRCPNCGADLTANKKYQLVIISPLADSPAEKAGLRAGDRIVKIGGKPAEQLGLGEAVKQIKGRPGTVVDLVITRDGADGEKEVKVTRSTIQVKSADWHMVSGTGIGYLHIAGFNDTTPELVAQGLKDLRAKGMRALLLDVRNNPGGGLDVCVDVASDFLGEGPVVYIDERGRPREARQCTKGHSRFDLPLAVLVNNGSASASEILAGAIQDAQLGTLVGETTYGKGLVQTVFPLRDGSALTLTTARYLTPKLRDINHKGIAPDTTVKQPESDLPITPLSEKDAQAAEAVKLLQGHSQPAAHEAKKAA